MCEYTRVLAASPVLDHRLHPESDDKEQHHEDEREQNADEGEHAHLSPLLATQGSLPLVDEVLDHATKQERECSDDNDHHHSDDSDTDDGNGIHQHVGLFSARKMNLNRIINVTPISEKRQRFRRL